MNRNRWCLCIRRLNVKMWIFPPSLFTGTKQSQTKSKLAFLVEIDNMILKCTNIQRMWSNHNSFSKNKIFGRLTVSDFKTYYKATETTMIYI